MVVVIDAHALEDIPGNCQYATNLSEAAAPRDVPNFIFLVLPQDGSFNFRMYEPHYMIHIPQHLLMNMLANGPARRSSTRNIGSASGTTRT